MARKRKNKRTKAQAHAIAEVKAAVAADEDNGRRRAYRQDEIEEKVGKLEGWTFDESDERLVKDYAFGDFKSALAFINKVGDLAEQMDHHPEIYNVYNQVSLALMTHDVSGISRSDFEMAERIDALA